MPHPEGAQFYLPMKDGVTPQMYYRIAPVKCNDGTVHQSLQYRTFTGAWHGTNDRRPDELRKRLIPIPKEEQS